jgi:hypothetical protein
MRFRQFVAGCLVVLSFCLTRSAWSQLTYTVRVVDKSESGSPLKISGTASFTELIVADSVKSSSTASRDSFAFHNVANRRNGCIIAAVFDAKRRFRISRKTVCCA